ncbi:MAG TPA: thymidylate kinase [Candidatus Brocadiia bacterium]|nr:thymidylate kinase [Candidatus Brocadiia bacterium]
MAKGALIVLSGIDGSGKTVQTRLLTERLEREGFPCARVDYPRYGKGFFADAAKSYLEGAYGPNPDAIDPHLAAMIFACDRWESRQQLADDLAAGLVVVANRYVSANMAHQGAKIRRSNKRLAFFDWVGEMEYGVFGLPQPDAEILLDMPPGVAQALVRSGTGASLRNDAGRPGRDIHEESLAHLNAASRTHRELARIFSWSRIACARRGKPLPPEMIADRVWETVSEILSMLGITARHA